MTLLLLLFFGYNVVGHAILVVTTKIAILCPNYLTHWGLGMHICISKLTIISSDNGLAPGRHQALCVNQWCNIVNWSLGNKLQWNLDGNLYIFIQENAFENVVWKMSAILSWPQCVKDQVPIDEIHRLERLDYTLHNRDEGLIKFNSLSGDIGQQGPYSPHNHSLV